MGTLGKLGTLVIGRGPGDGVMIGYDVEVVVLRKSETLRGGAVLLGFSGPEVALSTVQSLACRRRNELPSVWVGLDESVMVEDTSIQFVGFFGRYARLGITAPKVVPILRTELWREWTDAAGRAKRLRLEATGPIADLGISKKGIREIAGIIRVRNVLRGTAA